MYRLIGGDDKLIVWEDLDWLLTALVICTTIVGVSIYLHCIVSLWNVFWTYGWLSIHCLPCDYLGGPTVTWCTWLILPFLSCWLSIPMKWNPGLIPQLLNYVVNYVNAHIVLLVTIILHWCRHDGITMIYIHEVDAFFQYAWFYGEASA